MQTNTKNSFNVWNTQWFISVMDNESKLFWETTRFKDRHRKHLEWTQTFRLFRNDFFFGECIVKETQVLWMTESVLYSIFDVYIMQFST